MAVRLDSPGTAEANMAEDARLLEEAVSVDAAPALRLYGWSEPSVTYGRSQHPGELGLDGLELPAVRRPSGGLAALHLPGDLAFCLAGSYSAGMPRTVSGLFRAVLGAVSRALDQVGMQVSIGDGVPSMSGLFCASSRSGADLMTVRGKLCGSAQRRVRGGALIHGSLSLAPLSALPGWLSMTPGPPLLSLMKGGFRPADEHEAPDASALADLFIAQLRDLT